jgi:hypothetical protein
VLTVGRRALAKAKHVVVEACPPLSHLAIKLRALGNENFRILHREEADALKRLKANIGNNFVKGGPERNRKTVVIFGFYRVDMAVIERAVAAAFEHAGMTPIIVGPRLMLGRKAYKSLGLNRVFTFAPIVSGAARAAAAQAIAGIQHGTELHAYCYDGVRCGKYAMSTLMRSQRTGSFDLKDATVRKNLVEALARSIAAVEAARDLLRRHRPDALVISDRGYTPFGEVFSLCIADGIPIFTWNMAHRNGLIVMKRFGAHNTDVHHHSLSDESWRKISKLEWCDDFRAKSERELVDSYTSGEWYGEVGTQFHVSSFDREALTKRLALDPLKKTAFIFPHIFWDGTFFWGEDLFDDYEQWYCEVLKIARGNTNLNWVVKVHPANLVKDVRDKFSAEHSEVTAMKRVLGKKPEHIHLLEASSDISTLSLFSVMDFCLTVRGTIGIEAAYRGIPVLTAGTGRYDRLGFTVDFDDKEAYLSQLAKLETLPPLTSEQIDLARKLAFGTFALRPTPLSSVRFSFRQDAVASLDATLVADDTAALQTAPDIVALGDWILSGKDDFCNWELARQSESR